MKLLPHDRPLQNTKGIYVIFTKQIILKNNSFENQGPYHKIKKKIFTLYRVIGLVLRHFRLTIFHDCMTLYSETSDFWDPGNLCQINHLILFWPHEASAASNRNCQNSQVFLSKRRIKRKIKAIKNSKTPIEWIFAFN